MHEDLDSRGRAAEGGCLPRFPLVSAGCALRARTLREGRRPCVPGIVLGGEHVAGGDPLGVDVDLVRAGVA
ncbi:hypothetical protein Micbo1qcDRAFT_165210, partial [Microdochium bolleyi]